MVQGALVRAADIHAWPASDRLQAFEDLDVVRSVAVAAAIAGEVQKIRHSALVPLDKFSRRPYRRDVATDSVIDAAGRAASSNPIHPREQTRYGALHRKLVLRPVAW
jgi:hypothetical protein